MFCHEENTVEHAMLRCQWFRWKRGLLERELEAGLCPERIVKQMCSDGTKWRAVAAYMRDVIDLKKKRALPPT